MAGREGNAQDDEARFADLHRHLQAAQGRLAEAHASCSALADRVALAEGQGAVAAIGLLADLTQAERAIGPLEDDVLDAECALIMAGARGDDEPDVV